MTNEELVFQIQHGENRIQNLEQLYTQNRGIIAKIIQRFKGYEEEDDLFQEAYFGLARAAEHWSPEGGASFCNYAAFWIRQAIQSYIDHNGFLVRIPANRRNRIMYYQRTISDFRKELNRDPTPSELMDVLGIDFQQLKTLRKDARAIQCKRLEEPVYFSQEGEEITLGDTLEDPVDRIGDKMDEIDREQLSSFLWSLVGSLRNEQAEVIRRRFQDGETLKECGSVLGFTPEQVRLIEAKALWILRSSENAEQIKSYIDETAYTLGLKRTSLSAWRNTSESSTEWAAMKLIDMGK